MTKSPFVDYYEILECSPNANCETIERLFRHFAKQLHPDVAKTGDVNKFTMLIEAYEILKDSKERAAYDAVYEQQMRTNSALVEDLDVAESDSVQRHKILSLLYAKRRRDRREPGLAPSTLARLANCPMEVMEFHLWYFREKGWIQREESGVLSITFEGVDKIEATVELQVQSKARRLAFEKDKLESAVS